MTVHDSEGPELSDGKWHKVEAIQISGNKCIFRVDGKQVGEHALQTIDIKDHSVKFCDKMELGYSLLMEEIQFTGSFKNFFVSRYNENELLKDDLKFKCFETDETNGQSLVDFSESNATIDPYFKDKVRFANGEITVMNANLSFKDVQRIPENAFELEFDFKFAR